MNNETKKRKLSFKKISFIFINLLVLLSCACLILAIYMIDGVENKLRYIIMAIILIINIVIIITTTKLTKKNSKAKVIIALIISILIIGSQLFLGYFIYKAYSSLDNMNKEKITYTTALVTKEDSNIENINDLENKKIGIVVDETSIDGYIIGLEIINEQNLEDNNKITEYTNISTLIKDLYSKKVDAIIISKNYPSMFKSIDKYKNIESETKIIYEKSKTLTKDEVNKYTGNKLSTSEKIDKPFTMLVMGIDSTATELSKNATGNGDSLMLITFNPKTLNATIFSIPRDTYVPIACFENQKENKITHAAWNGESCMIKTIENFTGINIDYYVKINFQGVVNLVNAVGGIEVDVPIEFCESNSKRSTKNENLICLKKGKQTLNGEQALALARHRKTLLTGDLQRGTNQQLVVQSMINKIKTIKSANKLLSILDTISKSMDTNFTTKQILSFYNIAKVILASNNSTDNVINMTQLYLEGSSQMIYDEGMGLTLYNYIPNEESLKLIISAMKQNLELEKVKMIKTMDFDIKKPFKLKTIGTDINSGSGSYTLLPNFIGQSESYARNWCSSNGISVTTSIKTVNSSSGYFDGQVIDQSYPQNKRTDLISGPINLTIAKVINSDSKTSNSNKNNNSSSKTKKEEKSNTEINENNKEEKINTEEQQEEIEDNNSDEDETT